MRQCQCVLLTARGWMTGILLGKAMLDIPQFYNSKIWYFWYNGLFPCTFDIAETIAASLTDAKCEVAHVADVCLQIIWRRGPAIGTEEMDPLLRGCHGDYLLCSDERVRPSAAWGRDDRKWLRLPNARLIPLSGHLYTYWFLWRSSRFHKSFLSRDHFECDTCKTAS